MNPMKKAALGVALVGSTLVGGALGASFLGTAGAQDSTTATAPAAAAAPAQGSGQGTGLAPPAGAQGGPRGPQGDPSKGGHQANGITETVMTGDAATKATDAAKAAVNGGTVERVENDAEGSAYEAHVVKADGSHVTVKMDAGFKVTSVEDGMR
jgi:hypothetical protein